jgi:hypothetical protein
VPIIALDEALDALSKADARQGKIVEMKFFGGLSTQEIADVLDISLATVERKWATARIWLRREMKRSAAPCRHFLKSLKTALLSTGQVFAVELRRRTCTCESSDHS